MDIAKRQAKHLTKIWKPFGNDMSCIRTERNLIRQFANILYHQLKTEYGGHIKINMYQGASNPRYSPRWVIVAKFTRDGKNNVQVECVTPMRTVVVEQPESPNFAFFVNANFEKRKEEDVANFVACIYHHISVMARKLFGIKNICECCDGGVQPVVFMGTIVPSASNLDAK